MGVLKITQRKDADGNKKYKLTIDQMIYCAISLTKILLLEVLTLYAY